MANNGKENFIFGVVITAIVAIGLVSFTIHGDTRTVGRCDKLEAKVDKNTESIGEIKGDIKVLLKIQELENKDRVEKAIELTNHDST